MALSPAVATVSLVDSPAITIVESVGSYNACISISPTPIMDVSVLVSTMDGTASGMYSPYPHNHPPTSSPPSHLSSFP